MTNSRTRRSPPRGRGSSRSFVEKWYQTWGSSLYDWISRPWKVIVSSCDIGRMKLRPPLSLSLKRIGMLIRPVASQSSAGVRVGQSISCPPIALISSRMICSTFVYTRQPSGRYVHRPAPTWRMNPPRTRSLWLDGLRVGGVVAERGKEEL